jgi:type IV pilus assembly protein PilE
MITVVIIGVLAAVALPAYFGQVRKSRRADAINLMSQIAQAQERFRANCPCYAHSVTNATSATCPATCPGTGADPGLGVTSTSAYYAFTVNTVNANNYRVRALAAASQLSDTQCAALELRMLQGNAEYWAGPAVATMANSATNGNARRCWNR